MYPTTGMVASKTYAQNRFVNVPAPRLWTGTVSWNGDGYQYVCATGIGGETMISCGSTDRRTSLLSGKTANVIFDRAMLPLVFKPGIEPSTSSPSSPVTAARKSPEYETLKSQSRLTPCSVNRT